MKRSIPQVVGSLCASSLVLAAAGQIRADITNGFSSASNWTLNGTTGSTSNGLPAIAGGDLELTSNSANEDSSDWYNTQQNIADSWTASFTYQMSYTTAFPSQGFMFVLQNAGKNALGSGGSGQLGYTNLSPSQVSGGAYAGLVNVNPSWGLGFQLFGHGASSFLQLGQNGAFGPGIDNPNSSTLVMSRDTNPINFTISYYQPDGVVNISATDPTAATSLNYNVQLPGPYNMVPTPSTTLAAGLGQNTAYVGFTGATGGDTAEQDFTNFSFTSGTPTSPPSGYTAPTPAPAFVTVTRSPIALTSGSFNADVVVENTASLPAGATVSSSIATAAGVKNNALYEAGLSVDGSAVQGGLPTSHEFLSNGDGVTTSSSECCTSGLPAVPRQRRRCPGTDMRSSCRYYRDSRRNKGWFPIPRVHRRNRHFHLRRHDCRSYIHNFHKCWRTAAFSYCGTAFPAMAMIRWDQGPYRRRQADWIRILPSTMFRLDWLEPPAVLSPREPKAPKCNSSVPLAMGSIN